MADAIEGSSAPYIREPYFFSDIGPLRIQQLGLAEGVCEWSDGDSLVIGRDEADQPACVLLIGAPARLNEARALMESAA